MGGSNFSHEKGGVGKIRVILKRGLITYFHPFELVLMLNFCGFVFWCVSHLHHFYQYP